MEAAASSELLIDTRSGYAGSVWRALCN